MDRLEATPIPSTEGAATPFFSPDGKWVGLYGGGSLKRVHLQGGEPIAICDGASQGASWGEDDTVLFTASAYGGLSRVSANGGTPQVVTTPNTAGRRGKPPMAPDPARRQGGPFHTLRKQWPSR